MAMQIFSFIHDYSISESDKKNYILVCYTLFKSISFFPCNTYILFDQKQFSIEKYQLYIKCQVVIYLRTQLFYLTNSQLSKYNTINFIKR
jgi:hypothetical protein